MSASHPRARKPSVDDSPCRLLVQVDRQSRFGCGADNDLKSGRLRHSRCLDPGEFLLQCKQPGFGLGRQCLPDRSFFGMGLGALLCAATSLLGFRPRTRGAFGR